MSNSNLPKPLFHRNRQDLQNFVMKSSWQNPQPAQHRPHTAVPQHTRPSQNINHNISHSIMIPDKKQSLFDRYNRNNLLLSQCNPLDIQRITRNPIAYQQNLNTTNLLPNKQIKAKTMQNIPSMPIQSRNSVQQASKEMKMSKEAKMNEYMFNYRENAEKRKQKKMKFLDQVENKLKELEREAQALESEQHRQNQEIKSMLHLQDKITTFAKQNQLTGKLTTAIHQFQPQEQEIHEPKNIQNEMDHIEINHILQDHHEYNNYLLELADNACQKSRSKSKTRPQTSLQKSNAKPNKKLSNTMNKTHNSHNQTLKKPFKAPPKPTSQKLVSTWKQKKDK